MTMTFVLLCVATQIVYVINPETIVSIPMAYLYGVVVTTYTLVVTLMIP